ncbi:MAG: prolipoprotein diacylglyceryl transferase [Flavobacteriales bacterium]
MLQLAINWDVSPVLFDLGFFQLRWYSLGFVCAFIFGFALLKKHYRTEQIPDEKLDKLLIYVVLATILGARLGHVFFYDWEHFSQRPFLEIFLPIQIEGGFKFTGYQGLASHGGAIALLIALFIYSKKVLKKPFHWILDRIAPSIALAGAFIRFGNLMNSEIIGKPTGSDFGFKFLKVDELARHPAQLYESIGYLLLFFVLQALLKKGILQKPWRSFSIFIFALFAIRFMVEYVKTSQGGSIENQLDGLLSTGQWLSIPFLILGLVLYVFSGKSKA